MDKKSLTAINKWMFFIYNYPYNFISEIWKDEPRLVQHLTSKFNALYEYKGAYGVIPAFYGELSTNNRKKMMQWVMDNFNDEQSLYFKEGE